ncbi:hypothetical protein Pfo_031490 [Paulownia fortunei]|nr:hypothetical protein Pfo_031490 [Paulownia fortunei]
MPFIEELYAYLDSVHFNFKSFMAAFKFYNQYALKTNDGEHYVETYVDRVAMNALYYADGNEALALRLADEMIHQRYQPATPSFLNAGRARRGDCYQKWVWALALMFLTFVKLAPVMGIANAAGGVVPIMKLLEDSFTFSSQPEDIEKVYGVPFNYVDITGEYDNMVANEAIRKYRIDPRMLEEEISKLQQESGYPYIINLDTANKTNPVKGKIVSSNLCSEILQVQTPSDLNNEQQYTKLGSDISCNLGSINIVNMMQTNNFEESVDTMVRALTFVSDSSNLDVVPSVALGNREKHAIGLGAMGLAAYFAQNKMYYGDEEALDFTSTFFMTLNYYSIKSSMKIAKERHEQFFEFDQSTKRLDTKNSESSRSVFRASLTTKHDWAELRDNVMKYGMYHAYRHAIAPTGSISYVNDTTASLLPIVNRIEERQEGMIGKVYYPAPGLSNETMPYYISAYDTDMRKVIDVYAAAQEHIDQGMALTFFMRSTLSDDLYEWKKGGRTDK